MEILGLTPYVAALVIAFAGVGLINVLGWLKSGDARPNPKKVAASVLIAIPASILFVATELSVITIVGDELAELIVFVGLLAQVAGFDALVKKVKPIVTDKNPEKK